MCLTYPLILCFIRLAVCWRSNRYKASILISEYNDSKYTLIHLSSAKRTFWLLGEAVYREKKGCNWDLHVGTQNRSKEEEEEDQDGWHKVVLPWRSAEHTPCRTSYTVHRAIIIVYKVSLCCEILVLLIIKLWERLHMLADTWWGGGCLRLVLPNDR